MPDLRTRLFLAWFRWSRPMTLGVRGVVEDSEGRICLIRHTYVKGFHFPGGGVEHGETVIEALARELAEEAGIRLTGAPELFRAYSNHPGFRNDHVLLYRIRAPHWTVTQTASAGEIAECVWVKPGATPPETASGTIARIAEIYENHPCSDYWLTETA